MRKPELLSPAGDRECIRAAVENGADAVYFGLECGFNARARATNMHVDDLPDIMAELRGRGVKGFVTLNTLVFSDELPAIEKNIIKLAEAGVDAVLVQDLGLVHLVRAVCPNLSIHASTQMTLTSAECIASVARLGIERVVLARELSIDEITDIRAKTDVELETFVHGALCVAYSGQCLTSESLGGRSANRGQCAQACRLPYDLICDGDDVDLDRVKYLLSPQDLAAFDLVPNLIKAGVDCFKIEGRLKTPEYVANITRHYRQAIDAAIDGRAKSFSKDEITDMELSFSRGFSPGWMNGCDHKMLVPGLSSAKRGVLLGHVESTGRGRVQIQLARPLAKGDGIVFEGDREKNEEQGGRVYEIFRKGKSIDEATAGGVELAFRHDSIDFDKLEPGQSVWKTDDPKLTAELRKSFKGSQNGRRVPLVVQVFAKVGESLRIRAVAENGATCELNSSDSLVEAIKHPLTIDVLRKQLGRLGGSTFELDDLTAEITGRPMVPLSVLGKLRHEMIAQLEQFARHSPERKIDCNALTKLRSKLPPPKSTDDEPNLRVLCRSLDQLAAVLNFGVASTMVDFQDIREYRQAVEMAHDRAEIYLATPRIQKPGEMGIFRAMQKHGADGWLVRNFAGIDFCTQNEIPFVSDFSMNATNELTVDDLLQRGSRRVTLSYDLNRDQLLELVDHSQFARLEVVVHQHMPMFHMEHCVFCAVMSPGTNKTNCGRPCDFHKVELRDRIGMEHPLKADVGCRNTLFNAVAQSAAEVVPTLVARGVRDFRIELVDDDEQQIRTVIDSYRSLLAGKITGKQVWQKLQASNRVGITRGTLEERRNPLAIL